LHSMELHGCWEMCPFLFEFGESSPVPTTVLP
jgi:hypothetical protein